MNDSISRVEGRPPVSHGFKEKAKDNRVCTFRKFVAKIRLRTQVSPCLEHEAGVFASKPPMHALPTPPAIHQPILVTGASGFIGAHLCKRLREYGLDVIGATRQPDAPLPEGVRKCVVNLADHGEVLKLFDEEKPETVFHLAGHVVGRRGVDEVMPSFQCTLASTVNLLVAAQGRISGRFVLSGSLEEPSTVTEAPCSPYATTKQAASSFARMFHALYNLPVVIARVFMVYGPDQKDQTKLVPYVIESLLDGSSPRLGSGTRPVDWIHVSDVVEGLITMAYRPGIEGQTIDLGTGRLETVRTVAEQLTRIVAGAGAPIFDPSTDRPLEQVRRADIESTMQALGWSPRYSLEDGLADTVRWHVLRRAETTLRP
ncbi:MAG: NAD(P)-dependent oxidoreductase [Kiritimatiellia bacterium]